jgi:DNA topoisomerase-1
MELYISSDQEKGYSRRKSGDGFTYFDSRGRRITSSRTIERIESLKIPPAWRDVWICKDPGGHIQAVGYDKAERKQYIYHPKWREQQEREKYEHILRFARALPKLRRVTRRQMNDKESVLATAVQLLDKTAMRVGGEEYEKENGTYGLATLKTDHVKVWRDKVFFEFVGKGGKEHVGTVADPNIASHVQKMRRLPGEDVLKYVDENGRTGDVKSREINQYIKKIIGEEFSAKDFRTWTATVAAAVALSEIEEASTKTARKRATSAVVKSVAEILGNTPAVCRKSYIDPRVIRKFEGGQTIATLRELTKNTDGSGLGTQEVLVLALLEEGTAKSAKTPVGPVPERVRG